MNDKNTLRHYGKLGMKWGIRKAQVGAIFDKTPMGRTISFVKKVNAKAKDKRWEKNATSVSTYIKIHNAVSDRMNNGEIDRVNNKPQYKDKNFHLPENAKLYKRYNDEFAALNTRLFKEEAVRIIGTNPSGTKKITVYDTNESGVLFGFEEIKHASSNVILIGLTDENGHITKMISENDDEFSTIEHSGVLGMKWGRRKARVTSSDHNSTVALRKKHVSEMSNEEIRKATSRIQLEKSYASITKRETSRGVQIAKDILSGMNTTIAAVGTLTATALLVKKAMENPVISKGLDKAANVIKFVPKSG